MRICNNFRQEVARQRSGNMVNGDGGVDRVRLADQPLSLCCTEHRLHKPGNSGKTKPPGHKFGDRDLVGRIKHRRRRAARL